MTLLDWLGPVILLTLLGLSIFVATVAWIRLYLIPKAAEIRSRRYANERTALYNQRAQRLVDELVINERDVPASVMDDVWALRGVDSNKGRNG